MNKQENELSESELKKKAYLAGMRLKSSGLDAETIYAKLEKQGIPQELAKEVVRDLIIEKKREVIEKTKSDLNFALIKVGIGLIGALISILVFPENYILPVGIIGTGILAALLAKKKINEQ